MGDESILSQMIKNKALVKVGNIYNKPCVELCECQAPDSKVIISHLPTDAIVIKMDHLPSPNDFFEGHNGECCCADYVIICPEKKCILFIEIKRTTDEPEHIVKQLKGAQCLVKYCQAIGKIFWKEEQFLEGYKNRFISFGHTGSLKKRKTRVERKKDFHDTAEKALKVDWANSIPFKKIASLGAK